MPSLLQEKSNGLQKGRREINSKWPYTDFVLKYLKKKKKSPFSSTGSVVLS